MFDSAAGQGTEELVGRIYEAAAVPELWPGVLKSLSAMAGAEDAVLIAARGADFNRWIVSSPQFAELVEAHSRQFPDNERTRRLIARQHPGFITDHDVLTQEEIDREPVFQEFLVPRGLGLGVATAIFAPSGDTIIVHAEYRRDRGSISRDVIARLDLLRPHFARAALMSARLELERAQGAVTALQILGLPGAVLKRGGGLLAANERLLGLMPHVVRDRPARIGLADARADRLLADAIDRLDLARAGYPVGSIPIPAHDEQPPFIVHVVPVCGAAHDVFSGAIAMLVVTPVVPRDVPTATVIQGLFDLTPAEARIAAMIGSGLRPREVASRAGIAEETARTTLKRIFAKTGTHRQAELAALLSGAAAPPIS